MNENNDRIRSEALEQAASLIERSIGRAPITGNRVARMLRDMAATPNMDLAIRRKRSSMEDSLNDRIGSENADEAGAGA